MTTLANGTYREPINLSQNSQISLRRTVARQVRRRSNRYQGEARDAKIIRQRKERVTWRESHERYLQTRLPRLTPAQPAWRFPARSRCTSYRARTGRRSPPVGRRASPAARCRSRRAGGRGRLRRPRRSSAPSPRRSRPATLERPTRTSRSPRSGRCPRRPGRCRRESRASPVTEPLVTREPVALFDALERLNVTPRVQQPALDRILQRVTVASDPAARAGLASVLAQTQVADRSSLASVLGQEHVLWFLTGDNLRVALQCLTADVPDDRHFEVGYEKTAGYQPMRSALTVHPDHEVRDLANALRETDSRSPAPADLEQRSTYRLHPPDTDVESDEASPFDRTKAPGQGDAIERQGKLAQAVRHGDPETTLAGLKAIQREIDRGTVDWESVGSTVMDHLTDRWQIVRQTAARVLLHATWAGIAKPAPSFLADRLVTDEATSGVLTRVLVATKPDEWPAPMRIAPVFLDRVVSTGPYSERHAAGQALTTLARSSPDILRETIANGVERLADGESDALAAYHLLAAFDRLVDDHGTLADNISGYLDTVLTSDSFAGIPSRDDGQTVSPVTPEVTPPVDRLSATRLPSRSLPTEASGHIVESLTHQTHLRPRTSLLSKTSSRSFGTPPTTQSKTSARACLSYCPRRNSWKS